jgi:hypothetical protein
MTRPVRIAHAGDLDPVVPRLLRRGGRRGRHRGQPLHPGERGAAALQLLDPDQEAVQRPGQLPQIEHRGTDRAEADPAVDVEQPADQQDQHGRHRVRSLDERKEDGTQGQRREPGAPGLGDGRVPGGEAALAQAERLDGAGARGGRGELVGQPRVGRALGQVSAPGALEVPPGDEPDPGQAQHAQRAEQRVEQHHRGPDENHLPEPDEHVRQDVAQRGGDRVDVRGSPRREVARGHPLHHGGRQAQRPPQKSLADAGGGPLTEAVRDGQRIPGEQRLRHGAQQHAQREPVDRTDPAAGRHRVDDPPQQPGPAEPGKGRQRVDRNHRGHRPAVDGHQPQRGPGDRPLIGNRQHRAHANPSSDPPARPAPARPPAGAAGCHPVMPSPPPDTPFRHAPAKPCAGEAGCRSMRAVTFRSRTLG